MAQRRMFSKQITDTDQFLDMPATAQNLYFHLNMHADDDGFLGNAKTIRRMVGASEDDLKVLVAKQFILLFPDGVAVIRDWHIHNYIQKDRYHSTVYLDDKKHLKLDGSKRYWIDTHSDVNESDTACIQDVSNLDTQVRLGKSKSKERNINSASKLAPHSLTQLEKDFEEVWKEYPNKKGKKQAFSHYKAWRKKSKSNTNAYLLERLKKYKLWASKQFSGYQYLNGSTWFNGRFDDDYEDASPKAVNVDYSDWHSLDNFTTNSNFY